MATVHSYTHPSTSLPEPVVEHEQAASFQFYLRGIALI